MNDKELTKNVEKIKQFLTLPDYDKIDAGIELAISLEEPEIFEGLLDGCCIKNIIIGDFMHSGRPKLNEWMKKTFISDGKLCELPTGYYVFLSLVTTAPPDCNIDSSLSMKNLKSLNLNNCYLNRIPSKFSEFSELRLLDISNNNLKKLDDTIFDLSKLKILNIENNYINHIPKEIKKLENLKIFLAGCNAYGNNKAINIYPDFIEKFDFGLDVEIACPDDCDGSTCDHFSAKGLNNSIGCGKSYDGDHYLSHGCQEEFHKSELISRYDAPFCESCDDPDEFKFMCDCCQKLIAPFIKHDYSIDNESGEVKLYEDEGILSEDDYCNPVSSSILTFVKKDNKITLNKICIYCKENFDNDRDFNEITHSELIEFLQNHEPYEFARNSGEVDLLYEFLYDYDGDENDELNSILEEKWLG
jgi:hypothetical protein